MYSTIAIGLFLFSIVGPIDRTPLEEQDFHADMIKRLASLSPSQHTSTGKIKAAWGKVNITPDQPQPMAGYIRRENFDSVHDSLFCRVVAIQNPTQTIFILSVDLLLFPPELRTMLEKQWKEKSPSDFFYFSATHTHNGVGGWDKSTVGHFALGPYQKEWMNKIAKTIIHQLENLKKATTSTSIAYWEADASEYAENRVNTESPKDGKLRGIQLIREDSAHCILFTYSAHATSISKKSKTLSGDYPSAVIKRLEVDKKEFALYLSGMVGSHRLANIPRQEFELVEEAGQVLSDKIKQSKPDRFSDSLSLTALHVPITFGRSQLRISKDWKVRNWLFGLLLDELQGELTLLEIGNTIMIGTPCDFSGEIFVQDKLEEIAARNGKKLIITSFNGDYVGYITADHHYDTSHKEEVMALNWVGPYYGAYFSEMIQSIIKPRP